MTTDLTTQGADIRTAAEAFTQAANDGCHWALAPEEVQALANLLRERLWFADNDPGAFGTATDTAAAELARLVNTRQAKQETDLEAFRTYRLNPAPASEIHDGREYRTNRSYDDNTGHTWTCVGANTWGDSMWHRDGQTETWNLRAVIHKFGPLTAPAA